MPTFNVRAGAGSRDRMFRVQDFQDPDGNPFLEPEPPPVEGGPAAPPVPLDPPQGGGEAPPEGGGSAALWRERNSKNPGDDPPPEDTPPILPPPPDPDDLGGGSTFTQPGTPAARPWHTPNYRTERLVGSSGPGTPVDISGEMIGDPAAIGDEVLRRRRALGGWGR
jgi:hypothetical protein